MSDADWPDLKPPTPAQRAKHADAADTMRRAATKIENFHWITCKSPLIGAAMVGLLRAHAKEAVEVGPDHRVLALARVIVEAE